MKKALIFWGGWDGHQPRQVGEYFKDILTNEGFDVQIHDNLECLLDKENITDMDLIVPVWTSGEIKEEMTSNVMDAVSRGTGIAGCHGGMCDAFRNDVNWQFMTGGNWVSHPGNDGTEYMVYIKNSSSSLVEGISDFKVKSEQYYLHVDPAVNVLAFTRFPVAKGFHISNGPVDMPVSWTKMWGLGRVYYNSLGHQLNIVKMKEVTEMIKRGFLWASEGKKIAKDNNMSTDMFK